MTNGRERVATRPGRPAPSLARGSNSILALVGSERTTQLRLVFSGHASEFGRLAHSVDRPGSIRRSLGPRSGLICSANAHNAGSPVRSGPNRSAWCGRGGWCAGGGGRRRSARRRGSSRRGRRTGYGRSAGRQSRCWRSRRRGRRRPSFGAIIITIDTDDVATSFVGGDGVFAHRDQDEPIGSSCVPNVVFRIVSSLLVSMAVRGLTTGRRW